MLCSAKRLPHLCEPRRCFGFGFEAAEMNDGGVNLLHHLAHGEAGKNLMGHDGGAVSCGVLGDGVAPMVHYPGCFLGCEGCQQALVGQEAVPAVSSSSRRTWASRPSNSDNLRWPALNQNRA